MSLISDESAEGIAISRVVAPVLPRASAKLSRPPITGTPEILRRCVVGLSSKNQQADTATKGFEAMYLPSEFRLHRLRTPKFLWLFAQLDGGVVLS